MNHKTKALLNLSIVLTLLLNLLGVSGPLGAIPAQAQMGCPCSLWPGVVTPGMTYDNPASIELGLKFRATVAGRVTGVRFFKAAGATGVHLGRLWTTAGVKLAEVAFTGETASGWQTAAFAQPVEIQPGVTYIISYTAAGSAPSDRRFALTQNYFTSAGGANGPLYALRNGEDGSNGVYSDSGGFFTQSYMATNYWVDLVFDDTPDTTPPQVSAVSPLSGATDAPTLANVQVTFDEAMDAASITTASFELRDPADALVPAAVSYDAATRTAALDPSNSLTFAAAYTARVKGGSGGVTDAAGNPLAVDYVWTFTVEADDATPPTVLSVSPAGGADEVAVTTPVSAVFSEPLDPATVAAASFELRGPGDALVAAAVSYNAAANTATLTPTAALAVGTAYTARVAGGSGGVTDLAGNPLFADYTWSFTTVTPPAVSSVKPVNGAAGLRLVTNATVYFNRAMNPATITAENIILRDQGGALIPAQVSYNAADFSAVLDPTAPLAFGQTYTVRIESGESGVADAGGLPLAADYTWSFTTLASRPAVDHAPGGPILIVADPNNLYTRYYTEILRTEGFNEFSLVDLPALDAATLAAYDLTLLGEMPLAAAQVALLSDYVAAGGDLIAMRPDKQLAGLLGLADAAATVAEGYLRFTTTSGPGRGIADQTLQFHGVADGYTLDGATALATLYSGRATATAYPVVSLKSVGANGGQAAAFAFDLARSIVYTHQGNPAWQSGHVNPLQTYGTALDLFYPDWIDFQRITIPQADEQQRFLANLILSMTADQKPLPRFWYLPGDKKAAVILTGDDHWGRSNPSGSSQTFFDRHISQSPASCSVEDWECVRSSSYGYPGALLTDAQAALYTAMGFEFGLHADAGLASGGGWCGTWPVDMPAQYAAQFDALYSKYASLPVQSSERNHCYSWFGYNGASGWNGYAGNAAVEDGLGIRFDTNISYNPASWATANPGYQMGSAMMMRFAQVDPAGTMTGFLDIYNGGTQMNDDNGQGAAAMRTIIDSYLDAATGALGYYGGLVVNMHSDNWYGWSYAGSDQIVQSAQTHNIPVVSGAQMVRWLDGRNSSSFSDLQWNGSELTFTVSAASGARNLRAMLPARFGGVPLTSISMNGAPLAFTTETIKGIEYAFFPAASGAYTAVYQPDTTAPVISNISVSLVDGQNAIISWTTDEPSSSRVVYGLAPNSLNLQTGSTALVTAHTVQLSGLTPDRLYYFRVRSADASTNWATAPVLGSAPLTFTTPSAGFIDTTTTDFNAGAPDAGCAIAQNDDGEVILKPAFQAEFDGTALPAGWSKINGAGTAVVADGKLTVDGATAGPAGLLSAGQVLEARATFSAAPFQHLGFGVDYSAGSNDAWAIISTGSSGAGLIARSWNGSGAWSSETSTPIAGAYLGSPHLYRIEWLADKIDYYVDGQKVASHPLAITRQMRPMPADSTAGGGTLTVDWLRLTPYAPACTFNSRILDALGAVQSGTIAWNADLPAGTSLEMSVRSGDMAVPDASWSAFGPVTNGEALPGGGRYLQYRAGLATADLNQTPALKDVRILYRRTPDTTAPTVTGRAPAPGAVDVDPAAEVVVMFSEPMDPASFDSAAFRLRLAGAAADTPATLNVSGATATLHPNAPLALGASYQVDVSAAVADLSGNPLGGAAAWTFTVTRSAHHTDTTLAHFEAGAPDANTYLVDFGDGALELRPAEGSEFFGAALPAGWQTTAFGAGGSAGVQDGRLTLDGARTGPAALYGPGHRLYGEVTFKAARYQHFGFAVNYMTDGTPWAIFSTGANGDGLYARTYTGTPPYDTQITPIPGSYLGARHTYRIDWAADRFDYYVDGELKATHTVAIATQMRPMPADSDVGGLTLTVDAMLMTPYASPAAFTSRVHDAGADFVWQALTWTGQQPAGTSMAFETRTGNSAAPDETWSVWQAVTAGAIASPQGRYLQYRAALASDDPLTSPLLEAVDLAGRLPDSDLPAVFEGEIALPGAPPAAGDLVAAAIAGAPAAFTAAIRSEGGALVYSIELPADDPSTPARDGGLPGEEIIFTINGQMMAKAVWNFNTHTTLNFHPPLAEAAVTLPVLEGSAAVLQANAQHLGADALAYEFDCDGDGAYETGPQAGDSVSCAYADNASVTAGVRITDAQGGQSADTVSFNVDNVAPAATFNSPASVLEGAGFTLSLSSPTDPSSADQAAGFEFAFDCGHGFSAWGATASAACSTSDAGSLGVAARLRDKDGSERVYTGAVAVANLPVGAVDAGGPYEATVDFPEMLTGSAECPSVDTCSAAWDLDGDGEFDDADGLTAVYTWTNTGVYDIALRVSDDDDSQKTAYTTVTVASIPDVQLTFTATGIPNAIRLDWTTLSETGLVGFNLYRAASPTGSRTKLNAAPIAAGGGSSGRSYTFTDRLAQPGQTYYYWLEPVTNLGALSPFGPASAKALYALQLPLLLRVTEAAGPAAAHAPR